MASPFHLTSPAAMLDGQPNPIGLLTILLVTGLLLTVAAVILQRRDIRV